MDVASRLPQASIKVTAAEMTVAAWLLHRGAPALPEV